MINKVIFQKKNRKKIINYKLEDIISDVVSSDNYPCTWSFKIVLRTKSHQTLQKYWTL